MKLDFSKKRQEEVGNYYHDIFYCHFTNKPLPPYKPEFMRQGFLQHRIDDLSIIGGSIEGFLHANEELHGRGQS